MLERSEDVEQHRPLPSVGIPLLRGEVRATRYRRAIGGALVGLLDPHDLGEPVGLEEFAGAGDAGIVGLGQRDPRCAAMLSPLQRAELAERELERSRVGRQRLRTSKRTRIRRVSLRAPGAASHWSSLMSAVAAAATWRMKWRTSR